MSAIRILAAALLAASVSAGEGGPRSATNEAFERLKVLAGRWTGELESDGKPGGAAVVEYKLTSGGTALVETLGPGTPHEMVSVYFPEGEGVAMTHYCAMGNRPKLAQVAMTGGKRRSRFSFELAADGGVDPKSHHMHALVLEHRGDSLEQTWTDHKDGKPQSRMRFRLKRAK